MISIFKSGGLKLRKNDTQQNDIQQNDIQKNDIQQNITQHRDNQQNDIQYNMNNSYINLLKCIFLMGMI